MKSLKPKGCHLKEVPAFIIKEFSDILSPIISHIFNISISKGVFPDKLKIARVVPIFKKSNKKDVSNYRPISTISVFSKLFKYLMCSRLKTYLDKYSILNNFQFGFRSKSCTSDAVSEFLDYTYCAIDRKESIMCVFLDFSKAFDTVDVEIVLSKLYCYGIRGPVNNCFRSYLSSRKQFVSVWGESSHVVTVSRGVPQGSILGPVLFLLYINDIYKCCRSLRMIQYADDTTLFMDGSSMEDLACEATEDLASIDEWLCVDRLSLNLDKTRFMMITKRKYRIKYPIVIRGTIVEYISNILKYFLSVKLFNVLHGTHNHFLDRTLSDQVNHSHNARSQADELLNNVYCRTSCSKQNFLYHAIIYWNQLPLHLRKLPDVVKFKKRVRIFLLFEQRNSEY